MSDLTKLRSRIGPPDAGAEVEARPDAQSDGQPAAASDRGLTAVDGGTQIHDHVLYRLPFEPLAGLVAPLTVRRWLGAIFDYRARQTAARLR